MRIKLPSHLRSVWSSTRYESPELTRFARAKAVTEARKGLVAMSVLSIVILIIEGVLYVRFALDPMYLYTCAILVLLSLNMVFAARTVADPQALHLLGVTLLVVSGSAFVLLANYQQVFHPMLFASVAMLFIFIPMMSWGLGEALAVTLLIYTLFTLSTAEAKYGIGDQSLWTLQFIMLGASAVSLSLVVRNVKLRKHDIATQHDLVVAHEQITELSNRDPLTGAWNRRYFDLEFGSYLKRCRDNQNQFHFMLLDVDDFKNLNDECGHESGDQVLRHIGQAFESVLADNGHIVRMGGDEFAVVFADLDPRVIAIRGLKKLCDLNVVSKHELVTKASISIGVASVPPDIEVSYRQLYKQADLALYRAKSLKDDDRALPNIVVSVLQDPDEVFSSTHRLWSVPETGNMIKPG